MSDRMLIYTGLILAGAALVILIIYFMLMKIRWTKLKHQLDAEYGEINNPAHDRKTRK